MSKYLLPFLLFTTFQFTSCQTTTSNEVLIPLIFAKQDTKFITPEGNVVFTLPENHKVQIDYQELDPFDNGLCLVLVRHSKANYTRYLLDKNGKNVRDLTGLAAQSSRPANGILRTSTKKSSGEVMVLEAEESIFDEDFIASLSDLGERIKKNFANPNGSFLYLDTNGNPKFDGMTFGMAAEFKNGFAIVDKKGSGKEQYYIDTLGHEVDLSFLSEYKLQLLRDYQCGRVPIRFLAQDGKRKHPIYIDGKGKVIFDTATIFPDRVVNECSDYENGSCMLYGSYKGNIFDNYIAIVDTNGQVLYEKDSVSIGKARIGGGVTKFTHIKKENDRRIFTQYVIDHQGQEMKIDLGESIIATPTFGFKNGVILNTSDNSNPDEQIIGQLIKFFDGTTMPLHPKDFVHRYDADYIVFTNAESMKIKILHLDEKRFVEIER